MQLALHILRSGNEEVHLSKAVRSTVEAEGLEEAEDGINWKTVDLSEPDLPAPSCRPSGGQR